MEANAKLSGYRSGDRRHHAGRGRVVVQEQPAARRFRYFSNAQLELLLKTPYYLSPGWLRIDPAFDPLRKNARFQKMEEATQ